ncbi:hypothetical protein N7468_004513 [Penicillium chermesinum]|uniref:Uncharacterized protein n=1 Tax=Penicillium chermesinum TaxID=63820 RepID=A0A9W9P8Q1_9EURO|nr:uncharacterized protein N7468_004513 [Penicillium chermesinum]KAJ5239894.1 hypothetical protein N7468_004513 [Penicillium chermesinum]KAJ6166770.1 hypothetical protein N7470_002217 [Penicillium chermesinum]
MACFQGLGLRVQPWVVLAILALLQCGSAQFCSFWNNNCIDPLAQTAVPFDFQPLFNDPISLYYSFDSSSSGKGEGPMTKTAFWLGYEDRKINPYAVNSNRTAEVALRVGNFTGTPAGTTNGCDGIWGKSCSRDIKNTLQAAIFQLTTSEGHWSQPLATALDQLMTNQPDLPSCGAPVFDVASIPVQDFAYERTPDQQVTVMKAGSSYRPWQVWYLDGMTAHQQASQVAVGIISRAPSYDSSPPTSPDDIQIELVCLQAPQGPPSGSSKDDD